MQPRPHELPKKPTYRFRLVFECLCAFLKRDDDVLVVLPDGRYGCPPIPGGQESHCDDAGNGDAAHDACGANMPAHIAAIQFNPDELAADSDLQPDLVFRRPGARSEQALLFLTGQDIALDAPLTGAPAIFGGRGAVAVPQSAGEAEDLSWVADVSRIDAAAGIMDPSCAQLGTNASLDGAASSPGRVVARVSLKGGTLRSLVLGQNEQQEPVLFDFQESGALIPNGFQQAITSAVAYDVAVGEETVTLVLSSFDGTTRRLQFSFAGLPMGYTMQVMVKNMPLDSLLEVPYCIYPGDTIAVDHHFAMYYALSQTPPANFWVPLETTARANGPICPSASFVEGAVTQ